jgi:hypothetical protein
MDPKRPRLFSYILGRLGAAVRKERDGDREEEKRI